MLRRSLRGTVHPIPLKLCYRGSHGIAWQRHQGRRLQQSQCLGSTGSCSPQSLLSWEAAGAGPSSWVSATHTGDLDRVSSSQLLSGPSPAAVGTGGVNEQMGSRTGPLSLYLCKICKKETRVCVCNIHNIPQSTRQVGLNITSEQLAYCLLVSVLSELKAAVGTQLRPSLSPSLAQVCAAVSHAPLAEAGSKVIRTGASIPSHLICGCHCL